jgi:hypothetical protein
LPLLLCSSAMPRPFGEHQSLEHERAEIPGQIAAYLRDLADTPAHDKMRREMREWQIREREKRLAEAFIAMIARRRSTRQGVTVLGRYQNPPPCFCSALASPGWAGSPGDGGAASSRRIPQRVEEA